ncbi:MAG: TolC family outer membrane protein [Burkholderiaceae bacterium]
MSIRFLAGALAGILLSGSALAADLLQVYRQALAADPVFASARAARLAGSEKPVQGLANLLPTIGANGSVSRGRQDTSRGDFGYRNDGYTLSLSQPLFRLANWALYQEGKLQEAASEAQFSQAKQDLILRVAQAYFDVLAAQDALLFIEAQQKAITEQLASAKRNFEVGTATITDTNEAQARFDLATAQAIAARNDLDVKTAALEQIVGDAPGALAKLRSDVKLPAPVPADLSQWTDSAQRDNYGVIGRQIALDIAHQEIRRNRAAGTPTVDLVATRSHSNQSGATLNTINGTADNNAVAVQWAIPLFAGFGIESRVREAVALEDQARADLETFRRTAIQNARQSFFGVNNGLAQVRALEAAEVSSLSALESNRLGYEVGVRINIDVLNAQQQLFSTRRDLARARYDTLLNGLKLKAAAGTLDEADVVQLNALLSHDAS